MRIELMNREGLAYRWKTGTDSIVKTRAGRSFCCSGVMRKKREVSQHRNGVNVVFKSFIFWNLISKS